MAMAIEAGRARESEFPPSTRAGALRAAKRLDWRYLLPEPRLGRVVYLGATDDTLVAALRDLGHSPLVLAPSGEALPSAAGSGAFDVAVVRWPSPAALEPVRAWLRPGGWLYWEIDRRSGAGSAKPGPGRLLDHDRAFRALGLCDIRIHWHYPDFERCRWLVPLDEPAAVAHLLARDRSPYAGLLLGKAAKGIVRTGLLPRLVPCLSLIGRQATAGPGRP